MLAQGKRIADSRTQRAARHSDTKCLSPIGEGKQGGTTVRQAHRKRA